MKKAPVHAIYKRYDAFFAIHIARSRVFAGMKWKFFCVRKRRERTFIHNLCPLCGRQRGASSADRVGRDPCVPPRSTHCSRRGTRAPPYRVRRSYGADRVVRPYTFCAGRRTPRAFVPLRSTAGRRSLRNRNGALQKGRTGVRPLHSILLLYMTALSATMRCKNTAPACPAPHGHR